MGHNYGKHFNNSNPENSHHIFGRQSELIVDQAEELPSNEEPIVVEESSDNNVQETVNKTQHVNGVVTGCDRLNVREEASQESRVLCVIEKDSEVQVDLTVDNTAAEFYKITTPSGVSGYCMKKFITIN